MLHSGDGVHGVILSISLPPNTTSQIALFWSHLTTSPSLKPTPDHPGVLWQTSDGPVHVPSSAEEPCARKCVAGGSLRDCGPKCPQVINKLLMCSTGLTPDLSHHHWYPTRRDLAWSPRPREIGGDFVFLPSQPCAGLQFCPWCPSTFLCLARGGNVGMWLIV